MKKLIKMVVSIGILCGLIYFSYPYWNWVKEQIPPQVEEKVRNLLPESWKSDELKQEEAIKKKIILNQAVEEYEGSDWVGLSEADVLQILGQPKDMNLSAYGYTWYSYSDNQQILEIGIEDSYVVTAFIAGAGLNMSPFHFLQTRDEVAATFEIEQTVKFNKALQTFDFILSQDDFMVKPIILLDKNQLAQLYFDVETNELVGARYGTKEVFIMQKPYQMRYTGDLIEMPELTAAQLSQVNQTREKHIYLYSNFIRQIKNRKPLELEQDLSAVSFLHSQDMEAHEFFAHESPNTGTLKDRLNRAQYTFLLAGENIAANYIDGLDVTIGWLNSPGHRVNLLSADFNQIGVGVSGAYYTQNFSKNN